MASNVNVIDGFASRFLRMCLALRAPAAGAEDDGRAGGQVRDKTNSATTA